jgi:pyruvate,water dikinase
MERKTIYWLEEIGQEYNDIVGKKCANLGEMLKIGGICVPPGLAISIDVYNKFARETGIVEEIVRYLKGALPEGFNPTNFRQLEELSLGLQHIVESKEMPSVLAEDIVSHYRILCEKCGTENVAVSVRSAGVKSHPGQYQTYLNVKGSDQVLEKIIKVWSSIYNVRSISAALRQGIPLEDCPAVGICVLKMVNARAAGVCLTVNPKTGEDTEAVIETSWGLGEAVVSGIVTPDRFTVGKLEMEVKESVIGQKERWVVIRDQGISVEETPSNIRGKLAITEEEAVKIVEIANKLESHFGTPQDVEWAIDNDLSPGKNIILLQTRSQVGIPKKKTATEKIIDRMKRRAIQI